MDWRGPMSMMALAVVGSGLGYALSDHARDSSIGTGVPEPVAASSPDLPTDSPTPLVRDPNDPTLQPRLPMTTASLGTGDFRITFRVPQGWRRNNTATNEAKWKPPGSSPNTYFIRVEQITSQDVTIEQVADSRVARLRDDLVDFEIIDRGVDFLEYTYRSDEGNARHSFMRWIDIDHNGEADVEAVAHGRERDVPGTRDLVARVTAGMRAG